ncbi:MAG: M23 family metallopeptidase, partial [Eubacteriales bacterium]|nr:M23 family metallopeptidase [Eubacteriales bacterium]
TDIGNTYFVDNNGKSYRINREDAKTFISSKYAVCLYKEAAAPVMTLSSANTILPQSMTWKYRLTEGIYSDAVVPLSSARDTYVLTGELNIGFDIDPDYLFVTILNGEEIVFNDMYANISAAEFNENATLTVGVNAQWLENEERGSYGEASYTFMLDVQAPAEFYLGVPEVEPGEFLAITGKNVKNPADITFVSEPDINFTPVFFRDGDYVVALVPISYNLEYSPNYRFTITCGDSVTELTLGVAKKDFKWRDYDVPAEIIATTRTDSLIRAYNEAVEPYLTANEPIRYWLPKTLFTIPAAGENPLVRAGIGIYRTLTATGLTYRNPGVDFMVNEGTNVLAAYDGKVVYAGTQTMSGRLIIIEHGFGLKSVYWHMSSVSVAEGDMVKAGDIIGVVGSTGFTKSTNLHYGLYVFKTPVSPYELWGWDDATYGIVVATP